MHVVTRRGEGGSPARASVCHRDLGDNARLPGQTGPSCVTSPFWGRARDLAALQLQLEDLFSPFLYPPDFVAEGGAQELETLWYFITGT